jgi:hypothetical protein
MNLFIGLLNIAIEDYDKYEEFLLKKAKVKILVTYKINLRIFLTCII